MTIVFKKLLLAATGFLFAAYITACVTINIYFPAAAAEKAADKIIEEVWQLKNQGQTNKNQPSSSTTP